jgi:hypothetical protein
VAAWAGFIPTGRSAEPVPKRKPRSVEISPELLTGLRGLRRRFGGSAFDTAIQRLVAGDLSLMPGKAGRPGRPEWERMAHVWAQMRVLIDHDGLSELKAANTVAGRGWRYTVLNAPGPGGKPVVRDLGGPGTPGKKGTVLRQYRKAEKRRLEEPKFAEVADFFLGRVIDYRKVKGTW